MVFTTRGFMKPFSLAVCKWKFPTVSLPAEYMASVAHQSTRNTHRFLPPLPYCLLLPLSALSDVHSSMIATLLLLLVYLIPLLETSIHTKQNMVVMRGPAPRAKNLRPRKPSVLLIEPLYVHDPGPRGVGAGMGYFPSRRGDPGSQPREYLFFTRKKCTFDFHAFL